MQLTPLDVDYQREEQTKTRARLDELKKPKVIPQEKPPVTFSFKPATFDLLSSISSALKDSPLGFGKFIGRNPFYLRTKPSIFSSPSSSSFSSSSNLSLVKNPCYGFCSLSTPLELQSSRSSLVLSLGPQKTTSWPLLGPLKPSPVSKPAVTILVVIDDNAATQTDVAAVPF